MLFSFFPSFSFSLSQLFSPFRPFRSIYFLKVKFNLLKITENAENSRNVQILWFFCNNLKFSVRIFIKLNMETSCQGSGIMWFFKDRGFDDKSIHEMSRKCKRLESVDKEKASENWEYLKSIGIQERKLPSVIGKCPKILTLDLRWRPNQRSLEEKLCPLLAFFEALGAPEKQFGKMILLNPRIISYSIESKLSQTVDFLASLGLSKDGMIGKVLVKHPYIMGYSVGKRLRPTSEFLRLLGLTGPQLQKVAMNFPEVLCRDVDKILRPNVIYLQSCGFSSSQIAALVAGYPPILIKSVSNSLGPRIKFLEEVMGRQIAEVADYPDFFRHGLKKRLEVRQKLLKQKEVQCSLSEMLDCNQKKFLLKFGFS
ncbi:Mitochondrial transcription termination factor, mTERF [Handroanthus impetiginosus]|uniref:Mitochondrial transcription termination factor, mTERF n=2 Tax=Handroanthus impetiginosus TaxID=429701 RepID=A0A2G9GBT7_9LAMI|nr:Mitochondrial transcription termination factor, mTERF [Handroanthus impetiginosus]